MLGIALELAGWIIALTVLMSLVEHQAHRHVMHKQLRFGGTDSVLQRTFKHHAVQHHSQYRKVFADAPVAPGEDRGLRLNLKEGFLEALPFSLILAFFSWPAAAVFPLVVCAHHWIWNRIHLEMHKPEQRHFGQWRLYKLLARHHYLHHQHPDKNFNVVLPLADFLLGTQARATEADKIGMSAAGLM